jgi:glutamate---cysteine ligase / carboxylate-amine ligase
VSGQASSQKLAAFSGYGIELEYMIVDRLTLSPRPIADRLLRAEGAWQSEVGRGVMGWSNELALHVIEVKNTRPMPSIEALVAAFQDEIHAINRRLDADAARLMPTAMHPWFAPQTETRLWPHQQAEIYRSYDRIFDCRRHGWANLQSMHVNLPFADEGEFVRLHAAVRLLLPILPALAASSPIVEGRRTGFMDYRMEVYRTHQAAVAATIGEVIPETIGSIADYHAKVLKPMYRGIAPHDPEGLLQHEWLNARGAIPRFERNAIEIRVIDLQECPQADLAIAAAAVAVIRRLYETVPLGDQQAIPNATLVQVLSTSIRDAEEAMVEDAEYLNLLEWRGGRCTAGELWRFLLRDVVAEGATSPWQAPLSRILDEGPLGRRILRRIGKDCEHDQIASVYGELCRCLDENRMF